MEELLVKLIPNVMRKPGELFTSLIQTLVMISVSGSISFCIGLVLGVLLVTAAPGGVLQNRGVFNVLDKMINFFRSIPFIILLAALIPLTRFVAGTAIGTKGAIVPLVFGTVPFFSRQIESALAEVDSGIIEAAQSMGSSPVGIIFRVYLRESIPSITRVTTITLVSLTGLTAMAGAVGAGGLGDFAIRYGHQRNQFDVTVVTVLVILILVSIIQGIGSWIVKRTAH
jgi:D-methionine transport system permease protein